MIDLIVEKKAQDFTEAFRQTISEKVVETLAEHKIEVAKKLFEKKESE
jgi:hypothetical protein